MLSTAYPMFPSNNFPEPNIKYNPLSSPTGRKPVETEGKVHPPHFTGLQRQSLIFNRGGLNQRVEQPLHAQKMLRDVLPVFGLNTCFRSTPKGNHPLEVGTKPLFGFQLKLFPPSPPPPPLFLGWCQRDVRKTVPFLDSICRPWRRSAVYFPERALVLA